MNQNAKFSGICCAAVTPLNRGRLDRERFQMHLRTLAADGCDGVLVLGATGEGQSFHLAEAEEVIQAALKGLLAERYADPAWLEVRPPLMPLSPADRDELANGLRRLNVL